MISEAIKLFDAHSSRFPKAHDTRDHPGYYTFVMLQDVGAPAEAIEIAKAGLATLRDTGAFEELSKAANSANLVRPVLASEPLTPNTRAIQSLRYLAKATVASLCVRIQDHEWQEALRDTERLLTIARFHLCQPSLIDQLVGHATVSLTTRELRTSLAEQAIDEHTSRAFCELLSAFEVQPAATVSVEGERARLEVLIDYVYGADQRGDRLS